MVLTSRNLIACHEECFLTRFDLNILFIEQFHIVFRALLRRFEVQIQRLFTRIDHLDFLHNQRRSRAMGVHQVCQVS